MEAAPGGGEAVDHVMAEGDGDGAEIFFKGSISEAIVLAQAKDLVLIVFVAGENEDSVSMELTTFRDSAVLDEVKKQSLILRLQDGSTDATYFSAIFPVRHVPTITFLGYKGALLQQLEGYQDVGKFLTALRNAVTAVNIQLQRVAASAMVALLSSAASGTASPAPEPIEVIRGPVFPEAGPLAVESRDSGGSTAVDTNSLASQPEARPIPDAGPLAVESTDKRDPGDSNATNTSSSASKPEALKSSSSQDSKAAQYQTTTGVKQGNGKKTTLRRESSGGTKPPKVRTGPFLLQVRLTNGQTIQGTFESFQTLREVKNFVDLQRTDGDMQFRLAIPFPRKVFSEEDMDSTLSKLDIGPRSALILVSNGNPVDNPSHSRSSANNAADSSSQSEATTAGGSYVGRFLSFLSPYVYGRPAAQEQNSSSTASYNNANPAMARALREGAQPPPLNSSRPEPPFGTLHTGGSTQENPTQAGRLSHRRGGSSNVHTLRGDDDGPPSQGNVYWNGNSTQFGGNDESKED